MPRGTATLNFGASGASDASVTVTGQTFIGASSQVEAWLMATASTDHSADEHLIETIQVMAGNIVPGVGFTIYGVNTSQLNEPVQGSAGRAFVGGTGTELYGQWTVQWVWV